MLRLAEKLELPVIIHSRGTTEFIVDMLPSYNLKRVLLHWFSHPMPALAKAMEHGYYITEGPPDCLFNWHPRSRIQHALDQLANGN